MLSITTELAYKINARTAHLMTYIKIKRKKCSKVINPEVKEQEFLSGTNGPEYSNYFLNFSHQTYMSVLNYNSPGTDVAKLSKTNKNHRT